MKNPDVQVSLSDIASNDEYTFAHSVSTMVYALMIARKLNYSEQMMAVLGMGTLLHDIGKMIVEPSIMYKEGKLTQQEYEYVKMHTMYGYQALRRIPMLPEPARLIAYMHHERLNGTGYPRGLKGDEITEFSKIVAIADVYDALTTDRCYRKKWTANRAMEFLDQMEEKLPSGELAQLASKVLQGGSARLLRRLIECGEAGKVEEYVRLTCENARLEGIGGSGSLLLLAAMLERPEHAQILLDKGYDCNGNGLDLSDYSGQQGRWCNYSAPAYSRFSGNVGASLTMSQGEYPTLSISCATPLAAALLCGSAKTAEVLLRSKGIWKGESTALCRAAVMVLEQRCRNIKPARNDYGMEFAKAGEPLPQNLESLQKETLRLIFCPEQETLPDRETFLRTFYLQPASFVDFCKTETLRLQLESGFCSEEDARQMLEVIGERQHPFSDNMARSRASKLLLIKQYFPELCREGWVTGIFLREIIRRFVDEQPHKTIMDAWKQLCGTERDLTWGRNDFWCLPYRKMKPFLEEAGKGGRLVMDMDAVPTWKITSQQTMTTILKMVSFRRRAGEGIGGIVQQLLLGGNLRILQSEAAQSLLAAESPKALMEFLIDNGCIRQDVRSTVLTLAEGGENSRGETADWRDPKRWKC